MTNPSQTQTSPVARSVECQSPDHYTVEVEMADGAIEWVDCTFIDVWSTDPEPSCPGGCAVEDITFTIPTSQHWNLRSLCREALLDAMQGGLY
jgi:hypothetical protein